MRSKNSNHVRLKIDCSNNIKVLKPFIFVITATMDKLIFQTAVNAFVLTKFAITTTNVVYFEKHDDLGYFLKDSARAALHQAITDNNYDEATARKLFFDADPSKFEKNNHITAFYAFIVQLYKVTLVFHTQKPILKHY